MQHNPVKRASALAVGILVLMAGAALADPTKNPAPSSGPPLAIGGASPLTPGQTMNYHPPTPQQIEEAKETAILSGEAEDALNKGDYATAEAKARQALAVVTIFRMGSPEKDLAAALYGEGKMQEAMQEYQKVARSGSYTYPYALLLLQSGQWAKAVDAYNKALAVGGDIKLLRADSQFSPDVPQPDELKAAILIGWAVNDNCVPFHGTYEQYCQQAQAMFEEAAKLVPDSAVAQYYIGYGLQRLNRHSDAQAAFAKAASMGNSDVKACVEAGSVDGGMNRVQAGK